MYVAHVRGDANRFHSPRTRRFGWVTLYTFEGNMRRKRKLRMEVRIVPPGSLDENLNNPHRNKTPEQRRQRMLTTLIGSLAKIQADGSAETITEKEVPLDTPNREA